ncbi:MAG TPA: 50S ribosomal protein L11 methyltransferase [Burkholderiaceae bacterium]|nr:50S ribosomal protein L11 methyltransferase [Burkholderiaceae bacterium]
MLARAAAPTRLAAPLRAAALAVGLLTAGSLCAAGPGAAGPAAAVDKPPPLAPALDLDVPFVTTPDNVVLAMLEMAGVKAGDTLLDLGSGDGRIVITATLRYGVSGSGVEIDPQLVRKSRENALKAGVADKVSFSEQDLFTTDLTRATVITMYLLPDVNIKLRPQLLALAPGTRLVSHDWTMGDWQPDQRKVVDAPEKKLGLYRIATLMAWTVPANVAGLHQADGLRIDVRQKYQKITGGTVRYGGHSYRLLPADVRGSQVALSARAADGRRLSLQAAVDAQPQPGSRIRWQVAAPRATAQTVETVRQ